MKKDIKTIELRINGLNCADCATQIERTVSKLNGVKAVKVDLSTSRLKVELNSTDVNKKNIEKEVERIGYEVERSNTIPTVFSIEGMDCEDEAAIIKKKLNALAGIKKFDVLLISSEVVVEHDEKVLPTANILKALKETGMEVFLRGEKAKRLRGEKANFLTSLVFTTTLSGIFVILGFTSTLLGISYSFGTIPLYILAMFSGGYLIGRKGLIAARNLRFDMNFLMSIAVIGAACIGEWLEGATVIFLFALAQLLESKTIDRARNALHSLMELSPKEALVKRNGEERYLLVEEVLAGDTIIVKPGERIPLDGRVINGFSTVNQAPITGESVPVEKLKGNEVYAGTINQQGTLEIEVTHLYKDTTLSGIIHMVEECQKQKAPFQSFVDKFASYYTPTVIGFAILVATIPPIVFHAPFNIWFYRALVLLVISCPCALVISTPVSLVSGITNAARNGVLIKGGVYLEQAGSVKVMAFDKTGTLTKGVPEVIDIIPFNSYSHEWLLRIAASLEARSEHSIADAITRMARAKNIIPLEVNNFQSIPGKGTFAEIDGKVFYIGNLRLFKEHGFTINEAVIDLKGMQAKGKTVIFLGHAQSDGTDKTVIGIISVADDVRENGREALNDIKNSGIEKIVMLTGDGAGTARTIADKLNISEFHAELSPEDKVNIIRDLSKRYGKVAMVGDGVNDAPALAAATVGIAMGVAGTDTALETADVALMSDDLLKLPFALNLSKRTLGTIKENIALSILIKGIFLALALPGLATLWMAVGADMGASLMVIFNGLRLLHIKDRLMDREKIG
ncbi:MAG TPA: heavy metal translocating P-type ATPase [Candidatus Brocadiia bacterium]|nr:cadmium-translocating P-type ATPase [Planctomycetota bacterium]MDO8093883.1 heavy metal translocating P-type ATPase [Candidatus Brocadiales bacterium]